VGKKEPSYTAGGILICTTTLENNMKAPQKTKNRTAIQSSNPTPGDAPEGM
jgi:hypothetical protein